MIAIEDVLKIDDVKREHVPVPEWNGVTITVTSMTANDRAEIERKWAKKDAQQDPAAFRADVLLVSLRNVADKPWATPEQIKQLMGKNAQAVERLFDAACRVSAFDSKAVDDIVKN